RSLLDNMRKKPGAVGAAAKEPRKDTVKLIGVTLRETGRTEALSGENNASKSSAAPTDGKLSMLLDEAEQRFGKQSGDRRSEIAQTKTQLRDELVRAKEQLAIELAKGQDCSRRVQEMELEITGMKDQLRESHAHVRNLHQDKQRLERQMHD